MKKKNKSIFYLHILVLTGVAILLNSGCASHHDMMGMGQEESPSLNKQDEIWIFSLNNDEAQEKATLCEDFGNITLDNGQKIEAESTGISGKVSLLSADLSIKNNYKNPLERKTGAVYELKYSSAALITGFILTIGDKQIRAVIAESKDAQRIYNMARKQGLRASIAQSQNGIFRQKIENIPANATFATKTDFIYIPPFKENRFYLNIGSDRAAERDIKFDLTFPPRKEIRIEGLPIMPFQPSDNCDSSENTLQLLRQ